MLEAIREALFEEMERDPAVVTLREDIGVYGGAFKVTEGLLAKFGPERVIDAPISETAIVGAACGMAYLGLRPVAEMQFIDFIACCFNQVTNFFGIDCFDLEEHFRVATACPKYRPLFRVYPLAQNPRIEIELTHRHIRPFDRGLPYFSSNSFSTRVSAEADEGRVTIRLYMSGTECIEVKLLSTSGGGADELP